MTLISVVAVWSQGGESAAQEATTPADSSLTPRTAMMRSALLPGWGQFSNGRPVKATLFSASAVTFLAAASSKIGNLGDISDRIRLTERKLQAANDEGRSDVATLREALLALEDEHEDEAARRNTYFLGLFATMTFSALDAYIDAHLVGFGETPTEFELRPDAGGIYGELSWKLD